MLGIGHFYFALTRMKSNRRGFLLGTPLAAFGLAQFGEEAFAQTSDAGAPPADVVDFWVGHMGVPAHMVLGAQTTWRSSLMSTT